jgi:hypothetical protein
VHEHGADAPTSRHSAMVAVEEILLFTAPDLADAPSGDMRIPKEPVRAELAIPPLLVVGSVHVPIGSRPIDGVLNVPDRFMPMTEVSIRSLAFPALDQDAPVVALRRDRAHVIMFPEDEEARRTG